MNKLGAWGPALALALSLAGCGGGGGAGGSSLSPSNTPGPTLTPAQLTVNVDPACQLPSNGDIQVAPANAPAAACAVGLNSTATLNASGGQQVLVSILYGNGAGECPADTALVVSAASTTPAGSCGTLTNSFIPGQSSSVTLSPAVNNALAQFMGTWTVSYACTCGGDSGTCSMPIDASGKIVNGSCQDTPKGGTPYSFAVSGAVNQSGFFQGTGNNGADLFSGRLSPSTKSGGGTWALPAANDSGPWQASLP